MNQGFKLRFDQLREGDPTPLRVPMEPGDGFYETDGATRNVCFSWPDGRRVFFNYAYLTGAAFEAGGEKNVIRLTFSAQEVTLQGYGLDKLFMAFFDHLPRLVTALEPRYAPNVAPDQSAVIDIQVKQNDA